MRPAVVIGARNHETALGRRATTVGAFIYDTGWNAIEIDDRILAHLRIVMMSKLRRSEPFMFDVEMHDGTGRRSFWVNEAVPMQFRFSGHRPSHINRVWIEQLMEAANGPNGLTILPEPPEPSEFRPSTPRLGDAHGGGGVDAPGKRR